MIVVIGTLVNINLLASISHLYPLAAFITHLVDLFPAIQDTGYRIRAFSAAIYQLVVIKVTDVDGGVKRGHSPGRR